MDKRLEYILSCIRPGIGVADIGTDHGYLPIALAGGGYPGFLFASDKRPEPLHTAVVNAASAGVSDKIQFSQSDGLDECPRTKIDTIVIAGMGGDEICAILDRAPWVWNPDYRFFLQPMSKSEILRYFLWNNGFSIVSDTSVSDNGRVYAVLEAGFTGRQSETYSDAELFVGKTPSRDAIEKALRYLEKKPADDLFEGIRTDLRRMQIEHNGVL